MTKAKSDIMEHRKCAEYGSPWSPQFYYCCPEPGNKLPNNRTCGHSPAVYRIMGGTTVELNMFPWMALLLYRNRISWKEPLVGACGGSLITNRYVLTAAHCVVKGPLLPQDLVIQSVRLGEHDTSNVLDFQYLYSWSAKRRYAPPPVEIEVEEVIDHPGYSKSDFYHYDIALLRLQMPVRYTPAIKPICVLGRHISLKNSKFKVAGWGKTESGLSSTVLLETTVKKIRSSFCKKAYPHLEFNSSLQICVGPVNGSDTCDGDSGGPLMATMGQSYEEFEYVAGITSYGHQTCGRQEYPGVYTKAPLFFEWIKENLKA
ncbi:spaetzle-processing enzyme-like [Drosophila rhopaloa]|uniref:Peptidase S1 domain-containing protein n=1 Tax=Drosophila rhopaloa TaxID=1041015 RepID=A0ABM5HBP0_DRORH|nr:spaetzle-processing enzyme-like [Drosophila rhopaloa]